jgi:hypothetical protein
VRGRVAGIAAAVLLGAVASAEAAAPVASTAAVARAAAADTIEMPSTPLEAAAVGFAHAFATGSEEALGKLLSTGDIHLQIGGSGRAGLSSRQAVASLMEFLRPYDRSRTLVSRAAPLDGSPDRGFAEVVWTAHSVGTSDEVTQTLFLGLREDQGEWRIDEVRILR